MAKRRKSKPSKNRRSGRKTQNKSYGTSILTKIFASFLGAIFSFLGLGVTYVLIGPLVVSSWANNDYGFFIGALVIAGVAISGVRASRSGLWKGVPFHLTGILMFFFVGRYLSFFESLQILGAIIYLGTWVWAYLLDTIITSFSKRPQESS